MIARVMVVGALLMGGAPMAHAALSPAERKIEATVEAGYEPSVGLLERLVNQNSGSMNLPGVRAVADMLRPEFEALGFAVTWKPMDAAKRAGHLIAVHKGRAGTTKMLLIGHLDTVFEPDSPFQTFVRESGASGGDWARGPGVSDDKGGVVTMLLALKAMQAAGTLKAANIEVVLTGDEEDAGDPVTIARADLIQARVVTVQTGVRCWQQRCQRPGELSRFCVVVSSESEVNLRPLRQALKQANFHQEFQMPRHPRLALSQDQRELRHRQLPPRTQRQNAQPCVFSSGP